MITHITISTKERVCESADCMTKKRAKTPQVYDDWRDNKAALYLHIIKHDQGEWEVKENF